MVGMILLQPTIGSTDHHLQPPVTLTNVEGDPTCSVWFLRWEVQPTCAGLAAMREELETQLAAHFDEGTLADIVLIFGELVANSVKRSIDATPIIVTVISEAFSRGLRLLHLTVTDANGRAGRWVPTLETIDRDRSSFLEEACLEDFAQRDSPGWGLRLVCLLATSHFGGFAVSRLGVWNFCQATLPVRPLRLPVPKELPCQLPAAA